MIVRGGKKEEREPLPERRKVPSSFRGEERMRRCRPFNPWKEKRRREGNFFMSFFLSRSGGIKKNFFLPNPKLEAAMPAYYLPSGRRCCAKTEEGKNVVGRFYSGKEKGSDI